MFPLLTLWKKVQDKGVYSPLTQITYIFDDVGLVNNTDNLYGTVSVGGNVEKWKSIAPATVGADYEFDQTAASDPFPTLNSGVNFTSTQSLDATSLNQWLFLINVGVPANLKWSLTFVIRYGALGNTFNSAMTNDLAVGDSPNVIWNNIDNRSGLSRSNALISRVNNSVPVAILSANINNFWVPTNDEVYTLTYDHSLGSNNFKAYRGVSLIGQVNKGADPTGSEVGRIMNLSNPGFPPTSSLVWRTLVAQEVVESDSVRNEFINNLKTKYGIS